MLTKKVNATEYFTMAEVAEKLNVNSVTIRKYSLLIESVTGNPDYFEHNVAGARRYTAEQLHQLRKMMLLKSRPKYTLKSAIETLYAPIATDTPTNTPESTTNDYNVQNGNQAVLHLLKQVDQREQQRDKQIDQLQQDNKQLKDQLDHITKLLENKPIKKHWWQRF